MSEKTTTELATNFPAWPMILEELEFVVSDWSGDFDFRLIEADAEHKTCTVSVSHEGMKFEDEILLRVCRGEVEVDYYEDAWHRLSMGSFFAVLWFDACEQRIIGGGRA